MAGRSVPRVLLLRSQALCKVLDLAWGKCPPWPEDQSGVVKVSFVPATPAVGVIEHRGGFQTVKV